MRRADFRHLSWLVACTLLVQAIAFGWMRPAEAEDQGAPQIDGWVICTSHGDDPLPGDAAPAKNSQGTDRHDLTCTMCASACLAAPAAILASAIALPMPVEVGRIERAGATALQPRAPPFELPGARDPPETFLM